MADMTLQQFSSFTSFVDPSFWHKLSQLKLEVDKLEERERSIWGYFSNVDSVGNLSVDVTSFNREAEKGSHRIAVQGTLINKNTIESFRSCDKVELLQQQGKLMEEALASGEALKNPSLALGRFLVLSFADLKSYHFYYWFAFLAPKSLTAHSMKPALSVTDVFSSEQVEGLENQMLVSEHRHFCTVLLGPSLELLPFSAFAETRARWGADKVYLGFLDPGSMKDVPGWPLRSLLWLAASTWPELLGAPLGVVCLRGSSQPGGRSSAAPSLVLHLALSVGEGREAQWVGWERNERGKLGPRLANLSSTMDPIRLAESAVDLNLKLMKWRLLPEMDLDLVKDAKCLLLGAGTLGCGVARVLLGWGVRRITLVDSGHVSYSNPVRQSLFLHRHCLAGGVAKVVAAVESLQSIFPGVTAEGVQLSIPMPGHTVAEAQLLEVQSDVKRLEDLIQAHDVVFLLTDTRESRWLPTLLAKLHGKVAINAALGFDSFLVMRHGVLTSAAEEAACSSSSEDICSRKNIPGHQLGCYFCNDVVAPRNSMASRSLDQQCTVVRPGVAQIAAALAVELMVSLLQHPDRGGAPASCDPDQVVGDTGCVLGLLPHSIRGFLAHFQLVLPASHAFARCAACSSMVLDEYRSRGFDFLLQAFNSPGYLEEITGLAALQQQSLDAEVWALSDSEDTD